MENDFTQENKAEFETLMANSMAKAIIEEYGKIDATRVAQNVLDSYLKRHYSFRERAKIKKLIKTKVHNFLEYDRRYYKLNGAEDTVFGLQTIPSSKIFGMKKSAKSKMGLEYSIVDYFLLDDTDSKNKNKEMQFVQLTGEDAGTIIPRSDMEFEELPINNSCGLQFKVCYKDYQTTFTEIPPRDSGIIPYYARTSFYGKKYYDLNRFGHHSEFILVGELENELTKQVRVAHNFDTKQNDALEQNNNIEL